MEKLVFVQTVSQSPILHCYDIIVLHWITTFYKACYCEACLLTCTFCFCVDRLTINYCRSSGPGGQNVNKGMEMEVFVKIFTSMFNVQGDQEHCCGEAFSTELTWQVTTSQVIESQLLLCYSTFFIFCSSKHKSWSPVPHTNSWVDIWRCATKDYFSGNINTKITYSLELTANNI